MPKSILPNSTESNSRRYMIPASYEKIIMSDGVTINFYNLSDEQIDSIVEKYPDLKALFS
jgi:hypothetical protein